MKHQARKQFGQHFLTDQSILADLMSELRLQSADTVVEIGPGLGALTDWLLKSVEHLHVIEIDRDLAHRLRSGPWNKRLTIHETDVLRFDFTSLPSPLRVVGNLPYNISTPILFALLEVADRVTDQHFMLQKEVVDRMVAAPSTPEYGRLSVMLQAYYELEHLFDVPPEAFDPPPRVMSAIVRMTPKPLAHRQSVPTALFHQIVAAAFSQRRKMLRNTWAGLVPAELAHAAGIALTDRAEAIPCQRFIDLAQRMSH